MIYYVQESACLEKAHHQSIILCFPNFVIKFWRNYFTTSMFRSTEVRIWGIILSDSSIAIHGDTSSLSALTRISSTMNAGILILFFEIFFLIQFHTETWFLLINGDRHWDASRAGRPEKYNCASKRTLKMLCSSLFWNWPLKGSGASIALDLSLNEEPMLSSQQFVR